MKRDVLPFLAWLALRCPKLTIFTIVAGWASAAVEAIGITMFVPLLDPGHGSELLARLPFIGQIATMTKGWSREELILFVSISLLALAVVRGVCVYAYRVLGEFVQIEVDQSLREDAFERILALPVLESAHRGSDQLTLLVGWMPQAVAACVLHVVYACGAIAIGSAYLFILMRLSVVMTVGTIVMIGLFFFFTKVVIARRLERNSNANQHALRGVQKAAIETTAAHAMITSFGLAPVMRRRFAEIVKRYKSVARRSRAAFLVIDPLFATQIAVVIASVLAAVALFPTDDPISEVSFALIFMFVLFRLSAPATQVLQSLSFISSYDTQIRQMREFLSEPVFRETVATGVNAPPASFNEIELRDVSYSYPNRPAVVLDRVNITIPRGSVLGIVGPSGAGKSTLVGLLLRLIDPSDGAVMLDDADIRTYAPQLWRRRISVVAQDTCLLNDTIRNNLSIVRPEATEAELWHALSLVAAEKFVRQLPQGLDTGVGERSISFSGGQRQRLAIARALIAGAEIMILDEATSNLDVETEFMIKEVVENLKGTYTIIIITHKISNIRNADKIVVLSEGRVVEQGGHGELVKAEGAYARLVRMHEEA